MSRRCLSGSMSGTPPWLRSKCSPLGVIMPSSASRGVRAAPLPVVPGCERIKVRVTLPSYLAGAPYSLKPAPGDFIHGGTSGGSAATAPFVRLVSRPLAPSSAMPRFRKLRLPSSMDMASPRATLAHVPVLFQWLDGLGWGTTDAGIPLGRISMTRRLVATPDLVPLLEEPFPF